AAVDLAAMRSAMQRAGKDPARIEPLIPVDLIIDHSVQADFFGAKEVYEKNLEREYERNRERYSLLRWAGQAFKTFRVVPPGAGICHQVNLERLSRVVQIRDGVAIPDTLFGADSHTTMVNGLGVFGWGVGGIEAEAAMLGQPTYLPWPVVVGVKLTGSLPTGTTATDLVLTLTETMRKHGVVNKFVEFAGDGHHPSRPHRGTEAGERRTRDDGRRGDARNCQSGAPLARARGDHRWLGRDRRYHVVYEHVEPVSHDRGGPAREEGRRARIV